MSIMIMNTLMTLLFLLVFIMGLLPAKMMCKRKDYTPMLIYMLVIVPLDLIAFYILGDSWVRGFEVLALRGE